MKKKILSVIFLCALFTVVFCVAFARHGEVNIDERRTLTQFPAFPQKISSRNIKSFFKGIDKFIIDFFPERSLFISLYSEAYLFLFGTEGTGNFSKAFRGKDGWLFLGDDYEHVYLRLVGKKKDTPQKIKKITDEFSSLDTVLRKHKIKTAFIVGPNKEQIYFDKLPDFIHPTKDRYSEPVLKALQKNGVDVIDPTKTLIENKDAHILYHLTDTHWNLYAGALVYKLIAKSLGFSPVAWDELKPVPSIPGDLIKIGMFKYIKPTVTDNYEVVWQEKPQLEYSENGVDFFIAPKDIFLTPHGQVIRNVKAPIKKKILVIGDSFTIALQPYLAQTFETVQLIHSDTITLELLSKVFEGDTKPAYALMVVVERKL